MDVGLFPISMAALHASLHALRILAERGLVSPEDIDESLDGIIETLESLPAEVLPIVMKTLDPLLAQLKQIAARNWKPEL
jgi:hypothetical protein